MYSWMHACIEMVPALHPERIMGLPNMNKYINKNYVVLDVICMCACKTFECEEILIKLYFMPTDHSSGNLQRKHDHTKER